MDVSAYAGRKWLRPLRLRTRIASFAVCRWDTKPGLVKTDPQFVRVESVESEDLGCASVPQKDAPILILDEPTSSIDSPYWGCHFLMPLLADDRSLRRLSSLTAHIDHPKCPSSSL